MDYIYLSDLISLQLQYQIKIDQCTNTTTIIDLAIHGCRNKAYSTDVCTRGVYLVYLISHRLIASNLKREHFDSSGVGRELSLREHG